MVYGPYISIHITILTMECIDQQTSSFKFGPHLVQHPRFIFEWSRYREDTVDAFVQYLTKKGVPLGALLADPAERAQNLSEGNADILPA